MARRPIPVTIPDVSRFASALRRGMSATTSASLGHQAALNLVAKAAGFRNFQHLASVCAVEDVEPDDPRAVERALSWFDLDGRFLGWPRRQKIQSLCVWAIWAQLPDRTVLNEREISGRIDALCAFRDAAQIRRRLVDLRLVARTVDGAAYRRLGVRPGLDERAVMAEVARRARMRRARGDGTP